MQKGIINWTWFSSQVMKTMLTLLLKFVFKRASENIYKLKLTSFGQLDLSLSPTSFAQDFDFGCFIRKTNLFIKSLMTSRRMWIDYYPDNIEKRTS